MLCTATTARIGAISPRGGYDRKEVWNPQGHRAIRTATSKDFLNWPDQHDLYYFDSPSEQLYTNQVKPYHRVPHLLIGFPTRYVERGHNDGPDHEARASTGPQRTRHWSPSLRALPELEHRLSRAKGSERYGRALTEGLLMASRDGVRFKRWNEGYLRPGIERKGTWNYGHQVIGWQRNRHTKCFNACHPVVVQQVGHAKVHHLANQFVAV